MKRSTHTDAPPRRNALADAAAARIAVAILAGAVCHGLFVFGVGAMVVGMFVGMTRAVGTLEGGWAVLANAALLLQFPLAHSMLLTKPGRRALARLAPAGDGRTLAPTTYAAVASLQLLALFVFWSPSGVVWFVAEGALFWGLSAAYAIAWALLGKAMLDSGIALQSGLLGWTALARGVAPRYPDMPTGGLYRYMRHPIYVSFTLTLWTTPVWTPDQLAVASVFTLYCLVGPLLKERRFLEIHGARFNTWRRGLPYWPLLPRPAAASAQTKEKSR